jgi:hypothetical protein
LSVADETIWSMATPVYVEVGKKRVFACALDWPGWCRSGKTEELALETLAAYAARYEPVAQRAGLSFLRSAADTLDVRERLTGGATTDFGAPEAIATSDQEPVDAAQANRTAALLQAAWKTLDEVAARSPAELRKGPRGGGRDRDKMLEHVIGAEAGYARLIGVKHKPPALGDQDAIDALRRDILAVLGAPSNGEPRAPKGWPPRYAARRFVWHVLDHAWEMEDKDVS